MANNTPSILLPLFYAVLTFRRTGYPSGNGVFYLLNDHLKSSTAVLNQNGTVQTSQLFYPYGGNRGSAFSGLTTKRFTGQYHEAGLPGGEGLYYYNARWYDAQLGRFTQADTIVPNPGNPQDLNRYSYVRNNPLRYIDSSGHYLFEDSPDEHSIWRQGKPSGYQRTVVRGRAGSFSRWERSRRPAQFGWDPFSKFRTQVKTWLPENDLHSLIVPKQGSWWPKQGRGTISIGFGGNLFGGVGGRFGGAINFDTYGNFSITGGGGGGGYTAIGGSLGWNVMVTNAPTVDYLKDFSVQFGGSVAKLASVGGEWVIIPGDRQPTGKREIYHGLNLFPARGGDYEPWPFELHATFERDWIFGQWNIPKIINNLRK